MCKKLRSVLCLTVVLSILVNMLPLQVLATGDQFDLMNSSQANQNEEKTEDAYIMQEIVENRTEYSKDFQLSNGLNMVTVYPDAVHFQKN